MKTIKISLILFFCLLSYSMISQVTTESLVSLHSVTNTEMNALSSTAPDGALAFNTTDNRVYEFDGTTWQLMRYARNTVSTITSDYTLSVADNNTILVINSATATTLTAPTGFIVGYNVLVYQIGTGRVTVAAGAGATVNNRQSRFTTAGRYAGIAIVCTATSTFHITGDLRQ